MPFITEEIWQTLPSFIQTDPNRNSIMLQTYPIVDANAVDANAQTSVSLIQQLIIAVRSIRSEMNIAPSKAIHLLLDKETEAQHAIINENETLIKRLAKLDSITWLAGSTPPPAATALADNVELFIPLAGLIDVAAETARLEKEITKLNQEIIRGEKKLQNQGFVAKAPAEVVEKEKANVADYKTALAKFTAQKESLAGL